jgi:hypothetical protein
VLSVYHFDSGENYKKNRVKSKVKYESLVSGVNSTPSACGGLS